MKRVLIIALTLVATLCFSSCEKVNSKLSSLKTTSWSATYILTDGNVDKKIRIELTFGDDPSICQLLKQLMVVDYPTISDSEYKASRAVSKTGSKDVDSYELFPFNATSKTEAEYSFCYDGETLRITDFKNGEFADLELKKMFFTH